MIRCWYYDVSELASEDLYARALASLPWEERRAAAARFLQGKDRRLSLGAGLLAAFALREAGAADLTLAAGPHGKPYLAAHPGISFNISHSGSLAVCAVSPAARSLGVDVEVPHPDTLRIAEHFFTPGEVAWIRASADPDRAFLRLWTRKESFLKMTGSGLSRPLNSFSVCPDEVAVPDSAAAGPARPDSAAPGPAFADSGAPEAFFTELDLPGHHICVCAPSEEEVVFSEWSFSGSGS